MRWLQTEYILKGIYLGLLLFIALQVPNWEMMAHVAVWSVGSLVVVLGVAAVQKLMQGYRVRGRLLAFLLFLLLESPGLVYTGILVGAVGSALDVQAHTAPAAPAQPVPPADQSPPADQPGSTPQPGLGDLINLSPDWQLLTFVAGGAVLGVLFSILRRLRERVVRLVLSLLLAAALVAGALAMFGQFGELSPSLPRLQLHATPALFAAALLLGVPFFYLLAFTGREEESEMEIGAICAALGLGAWMLIQDQPSFLMFRTVVFVVPLVLYFAYTWRIMPGLRVFKHSLRGLSYLQVGRYRPAVLSFRRALQLDPKNKLAREGLWNVHRSIDVNQLSKDPQLLGLIDLDLCLDRAGSLLLEAGPTPAQLEEAHRLLELILSQRPEMRPRVQYWRAVAFTHARQYDRAAAELEQVLDPVHSGADNPHRQYVLLPAWNLALLLHDELRGRVGWPQLAHRGRRMEAISAVERFLAANSEDRSFWNLKQLLYQDLTEAEYDDAAGAPGLVLAHFDHDYAQQLGLALINDPVHWHRGGEFLRLAARGMPALSSAIFIQIAEAHQRAGNVDQARHNYELAKRAGQSVGPQNLATEDRQAYFATVKMLAEEAMGRGDLDTAIENYTLYAESERSGVETLRTLADLHERKGDPLLALRATEKALLYNPSERNLLERKDRYYYSVLPEDLRARIELVQHCFDVDYCLRKADTLLKAKNVELDVIDWAQHLVELALVFRPEHIPARVMRARCLLRRGETEQAVGALEELRNPRPENFADSDAEEAWYLASRLLGDLYLQQLGQPELAIACYNDYRKSAKSGAETSYKMGQAYEQIGDRVRAKRCYELVTAYEGNPLVYEAKQALYRLQSG
jgi:tetratricopeptide (TPR) repeat protein